MRPRRVVPHLLLANTVADYKNINQIALNLQILQKKESVSNIKQTKKLLIRAKFVDTS